MNAINKLQALVNEIIATKGEDMAVINLGPYESGTIAVPAEYVEQVREIFKDAIFGNIEEQVVLGSHCFGFHTVNSEALTQVRMKALAKQYGFEEMTACLEAGTQPAFDDAVALAQSLLLGTIFAAEAYGDPKSAETTLADPKYFEFVTMTIEKNPLITANADEIMSLVKTYTDQYLTTQAA